MIQVFMGVIGSGKDFNASKLQEKGWARVDFKDGLLSLASDIVGYNVKTDYDFFKENIVGVRRPDNRFVESFVKTDTEQLKAQFPELMTGRRLLQRLGTEGMRKRDPDYWINQYRVNVLSLDDSIDVVTADCRFLNEVDTINKLDKARFVFCDYKSSRYNPGYNHESEALAQALLKIGLKDGEEILDIHFAEVQQLQGAVK